jgi:Zn-finger nucleic acid-binding protein
MTEDEKSRLVCPVCGTGLLPREFHDEVVAKCPECGGMWFDSEELLRAQQHLDSSIVWPERLAGYADTLEVKRDRSMVCPRDEVALVSIHYGPSAVVVDVCPNCSGIWFDHGEFEKVARDLQEASVSKTSLEYLKDVAYEIGDLFTGKKSLSEEIEDIGKTWHLVKNRLAIDHPLLVNFVVGMGKSFT